MIQSLVNLDAMKTEFQEFVTKNSLDLISIDLFDRQNRERLIPDEDSHEDLLSGLRSRQRILRLDPDCFNAELLLSYGFDSAHRITSISRSQFVQRFAEQLHPQGAEKPARFTTKPGGEGVRFNLVAALHGSIASPHTRSLAGANISDKLANHFETLSSYQQMFGSLNYCHAGDEVTILSPAAYLVDLLRIIDLAITVPNSTRPSAEAVKAARRKFDSGGSLSDKEINLLFEQNIPPGLTLNERRPDLGNIQLTTGNTYDEVPYLEIVAVLFCRP